ncbi:MAG TPA: endonuclease domain-containing protein [Caulobacteraceae bacterium]
MPSANPEVQRRASAAYRLTHPVKVAEYNARWYLKNRGKKLAYNRRNHDERKYGDPDIRAKLLSLQGGVCAGCGSPDPEHSRGWQVDHCHETNVVRSVLCHPCNTALGLLKENADRIRRLAAYAEKINE